MLLHMFGKPTLMLRTEREVSTEHGNVTLQPHQEAGAADVVGAVAEGGGDNHPVLLALISNVSMRPTQAVGWLENEQPIPTHLGALHLHQLMLQPASREERPWGKAAITWALGSSKARQQHTKSVRQWAARLGHCLCCNIGWIPMEDLAACFCSMPLRLAIASAIA